MACQGGIVTSLRAAIVALPIARDNSRLRGNSIFWLSELGRDDGVVRSLPKVAGHSAAGSAAAPLSTAGHRALRRRSGRDRERRPPANGACPHVSEQSPRGRVSATADRAFRGQAVPAVGRSKGRV